MRSLTQRSVLAAAGSMIPLVQMRVLSMRIFPVGLASLLLFVGICPGRQIQSWPYDKLFKRADLVLVVEPLSVRDAKEADGAVPPAEDADILVGVVTSFTVLSVVKGEYKQEKFDLIHFRLKEGVQIANGPCLVSFHTKRFDLQGRDWSRAVLKSEYMLFLKKRKDGRFEPVSGQIDPELSVKQVLEPLP